MRDLNKNLSQHVLYTTYADLPETVVSSARVFFLDTLGVGVAGAKAPLADEVRGVAMSWGTAGEQSATVWGTEYKAPVTAAAYVNAFQIHCQEYDCVHEPAVVHPLATILSAIMAEAEGQGTVDGKKFITAMAIAVDVAAGLGVATLSPIRFFRPATAGIFGATAGIAHLRGFTEEKLFNAWGYALAQTAGTMQAHVEGTPALPIQIAGAARAAHIACDLSETGLTGPHDVFEGPFGYFNLFELESDVSKGFGDLGNVWRLAEVSHKPFPTGRAAHGGITALQNVMRDNEIQVDEIDTIVLRAPPLIKRLIGRELIEPLHINYARLCFPYLAAVTVLNGTVGLNDFSTEALSEQKRMALARKVAVVDDGSSDPAAFTPQQLHVRLKDGTIHESYVSELPGSPASPLTRTEYTRKFKECLANVREQEADSIIHRVDKLEDETDVGSLVRMVSTRVGK